jgi:hypothetical protein
MRVDLFAERHARGYGDRLIPSTDADNGKIDAPMTVFRVTLYFIAHCTPLHPRLIASLQQRRKDRRHHLMRCTPSVPTARSIAALQQPAAKCHRPGMQRGTLPWQYRDRRRPPCDRRIRCGTSGVSTAIQTSSPGCQIDSTAPPVLQPQCAEKTPTAPD